MDDERQNVLIDDVTAKLQNPNVDFIKFIVVASHKLSDFQSF